MGLLGQSKTVSKDWEGTRKFHNLMWDMQNIYEDKIWQLYSEREIGFTYRSQFERSIDELPKELQALIFSKVGITERKELGLTCWEQHIIEDTITNMKVCFMICMLKKHSYLCMVVCMGKWET